MMQNPDIIKGVDEQSTLEHMLNSHFNNEDMVLSNLQLI